MENAQIKELLYGIIDIVERNKDIYLSLFITPEHVNVTVYPNDTNEEV